MIGFDETRFTEHAIGLVHAGFCLPDAIEMIRAGRSEPPEIWARVEAIASAILAREIEQTTGPVYALAWSRDRCIAFLCWCDADGLWTDDDLAGEDCRPMTESEARAWVLWHASEQDPKSPAWRALLALATAHGFRIGDNGPELDL